MKATKITNVNLVVSHFLKQKVWRGMFIQFIVATNITNVNLVTNHLLEKTLCRITSTVHTVHESIKDHKWESCGK